MKTKTYYWDDSKGWLTKVDFGDEVPLEGTLYNLIVTLSKLQEHSVMPKAIKYEISSETGCEDTSHPVLEIYYERPATAQEIEKAQAERLAKQAEHDAWQYQQYQALRQKFRGM